MLVCMLWDAFVHVERLNIAGCFTRREVSGIRQTNRLSLRRVVETQRRGRIMRTMLKRCHRGRRYWLLDPLSPHQTGWTDVVLLERDELTSGSRGMRRPTSTACMTAPTSAASSTTRWTCTSSLRQKRARLRRVPARIAVSGADEAREHQLRLQAAKAKLYGMNFHESDRDEAERLHPLVNYDGIRCIMWEPDGRQCGPFGRDQCLCHRRAAERGRNHPVYPVTGTEAAADGTWIVQHRKGRHRDAMGDQCGGALGPREWPRWQGSNCRCNRQSTSISSPKPSPRSRHGPPPAIGGGP